MGQVLERISHGAHVLHQFLKGFEPALIEMCHRGVCVWRSEGARTCLVTSLDRDESTLGVARGTERGISARAAFVPRREAVKLEKGNGRSKPTPGKPPPFPTHPTPPTPVTTCPLLPCGEHTGRLLLLIRG